MFWTICITSKWDLSLLDLKACPCLMLRSVIFCCLLWLDPVSMNAYKIPYKEARAACTRRHAVDLGAIPFVGQTSPGTPQWAEALWWPGHCLGSVCFQSLPDQVSGSEEDRAIKAPTSPPTIVLFMLCLCIFPVPHPQC